MPRISLVEAARQLIAPKLSSGDFAVDATVGNGHDTAFLLNRVQPDGRVYGFDIQAQALANARGKLGDHACLTLLPHSHADMGKHIPPVVHGQVRAVMFNLGYLPGSDKQITTCPGSTLKALATACRLLAKGGIITVIAYPGHDGGANEAALVAKWQQQLDAALFKTSKLASVPGNCNAPILYGIAKQFD